MYRHIEYNSEKILPILLVMVLVSKKTKDRILSRTVLHKKVEKLNTEVSYVFREIFQQLLLKSSQSAQQFEN